MIVISDTSPLNYLVLIGHVEVLFPLYRQILVPTTVARELGHPAASNQVRAFIANPPAWLTIQSPRHIDASIGLGPGESEAISLALELQADRILIDDRPAYRAAVHRGLRVSGTLTVLAEASAAALLVLPEAIQKLRTTNFRIAEQVIQELLKFDARRRSGSPPLI